MRQGGFGRTVNHWAYREGGRKSEDRYEYYT